MTKFVIPDESRCVDPAVVEAQVHRMQQDPRAGALLEDFAGQRLYLSILDERLADLLGRLSAVVDPTIDAFGNSDGVVPLG